MPTNPINQRIFTAMKEQNKTQAALAAFIDVAPNTVTSWNRSLSTPSIDKIAGIADFLGVSLDYLIRGHELTQTQKENQSTQNMQTDYKYERVCGEVQPLEMRSIDEITEISKKLNQNQKSLVYEYALGMTEQGYEIKKWNNIRFDFIRRYLELIDNPFFRNIMELFLHIKPQDIPDIYETLCRAMEKKNYNTTKPYIEAYNYFQNENAPLVFTTTALSDKFVEDFQELIYDKSFNETAKLFIEYPIELREQILEMIINWLTSYINANEQLKRKIRLPNTILGRN